MIGYDLPLIDVAFVFPWWSLHVGLVLVYVGYAFAMIRAL